MRLLYLLFILLFTSCGVGFQYSTLNHAGHIDGIYSSNDYKIDTLNEFQVRNKLRTDFYFKYDIAQYALSQPASFDWNNRLLGNRYNWSRPYWGYNYYWNRTQMWNDWVWGYNWYSPHRWSPFNNNWGSYSYYGWNNYYSYNSRFYNRYRGTNVVYHNSRRSSTHTTTNRRVINNNRVVTAPRTRTIIKNKPRIIKNKPRINIPRTRISPPRTRVNTLSRQFSTIRTTPRTSTRSNNNTTIRSNSRRKN
jgi:hypothetical protein